MKSVKHEMNMNKPFVPNIVAKIDHALFFTVLSLKTGEFTFQRHGYFRTCKKKNSEFADQIFLIRGRENNLNKVNNLLGE